MRHQTNAKIAAILQFDTRDPNASNLGRFYQRSMSRPNAAPKAATATMPNVYNARNGITRLGAMEGMSRTQPARHGAGGEARHGGI